MKCRCGGDLEVIDTRDGPMNTVRRRRECKSCQLRYTTHESIGAPDIAVLERHRKTRRESAKRTWARLPAAEKTRRNRRKKMRMLARQHAIETGERVDHVYRQWGCE